MDESERAIRLPARILAAVARLTYRYRVASFALVAALTVLAFGQARRLSLDTDLVHLLPPHAESVVNIEKLQERSAGVGYLAVVLSGADSDARERLADELAPRLEALPSIAWVEGAPPEEFFRDHALYYVDIEDLREVRDRIEARREWEARKHNPMLDLELDELPEDPPSLELTDMKDKYAERLAELGGKPRGGRYLTDDQSGLLVLLAKPARQATNVVNADQVVTEVQGLVAALDRSSYAAELRVELSGRYKKKYDQKRQIQSDLQLASWLALALMVTYLAFHFRRASAVVLVLVPLTVGVLWTFGLAGAIFGTLNLLTGFVGAILLGLGIDHGIHLLSRVDEQRASGQAPLEAVVAGFAGTGRAVVVAAITTAFGFAGAALSEFRAFRELGVIAGLGMVAVVLSYLVLLPALLSLRALHGGPTRSLAVTLERRSSFARSLPRFAPVYAWLSLLAALALGSQVTKTRFDYDFASLEDSSLPSFELDKKINRMLGRSQTPLAAFAHSPAEEAAVEAALKQRATSAGRNTIQQVVALADLVPADQLSKRAVIRQIGESVSQVKPTRLSPEQRKRREDVMRMAAAEPFTRAELPAEVSRSFLARDGAGSFVLVFPSVSQSDGAGVRRLSEALRNVTLEDGSTVQIAGGALVTAEVLAMVEQEAPEVLLVTMVLVAIAIGSLLGLRMLLPSLGVAAATLLVTAGLMPLCEVSFNYLNVVMVPVLFGVSVDGAVHVLTRLQDGQDIVDIVSETGRALSGAILTTGLGFGTLLLADHPGLRSLASVALLGLAVNLLMCLVALPSLVALARGGPGRADSPRGAGRARGWASLVATVGHAGYSPIAPGTVGALAAVPVAILLASAGAGVQLAAVVVTTLVALEVTRRHLRVNPEEDPQEVVVDEWVGCLLAMLLVPPEPIWWLFAWAGFRLLDIFKPWPIGWVERRMRGAVAVVGDDVVAGAIAGGLLWGLHRVLQAGVLA